MKKKCPFCGIMSWVQNCLSQEGRIESQINSDLERDSGFQIILADLKRIGDIKSTMVEHLARANQRLT